MAGARTTRGQCAAVEPRAEEYTQHRIVLGSAFCANGAQGGLAAGAALHAWGGVPHCECASIQQAACGGAISGKHGPEAVGFRASSRTAYCAASVQQALLLCHQGPGQAQRRAQCSCLKCAQVCVCVCANGRYSQCAQPASEAAAYYRCASGCRPAQRCGAVSSEQCTLLCQQAGIGARTIQLCD